MAQWYAVYMYPVIVGTTGRIFGLFPMSVVEVLLYVTICLVPASMVRLLVRLILRKAGKAEAAHYFSGIWLTASVLFLLYTLNCGINYQRKSFSEQEGIVTEAYSVEELQRVLSLIHI